MDANKNPITEAAFGLFLIWVGVSFYDYLSRARWLNEIGYSTWYDVSTDHVKQLEDKPPTDCNFFRAPIGFKGCTYEKRIRTWQRSAKFDTSDFPDKPHS